MSDEIQDTYTPKVSVRLNRFAGRDEILVTVLGDRYDDDAIYFTKLLTSEEGVGLVLDPINHPHEVLIEDENGIHGGGFEQLSDRTGAFLAHPPRALADLLFPAGATEVTLPGKAASGEFELSFALPEGRSLLSLFFRDPLPTPSAPGCQPEPGKCLNLVTA